MVDSCLHNYRELYTSWMCDIKYNFYTFCKIWLNTSPFIMIENKHILLDSHLFSFRHPISSEGCSSLIIHIFVSLVNKYTWENLIRWRTVGCGGYIHFSHSTEVSECIGLISVYNSEQPTTGSVVGPQVKLRFIQIDIYFGVLWCFINLTVNLWLATHLLI